MTKISIIIPVYNAEKYLTMSLVSVQSQTFDDFEAICMDDGSTDNSYQILKSFADTDKRFKVYHQENAGGSEARNNALSYATGDYIAFLDNDDIYHPQYLEILYNNIIKYKADVSTCSYLKFYGYNNYIFENKVENNKIDFVTDNPFIDKFKNKRKIETLMWAKLYKKEVLENIRFSPKLPAINDILFNIEVLLSVQRVVVSNQKLIAYRIIETSQTQQKLSLKKLDEYKNLAIEIFHLTEKFSKYKEILERVIANYVFGMYVKDIEELQNKNLSNQIICDLNDLKKLKIFKINKLSLSKRIKLFIFRYVTLGKIDA